MLNLKGACTYNYVGRGTMKINFRAILEAIRSCARAGLRFFFGSLKLASIIFLVFFIPKLISVWSSAYQGSPAASRFNRHHRVRMLFGIENLIYNQQRYKGLKHYRYWLFHDDSDFGQTGKRSSEFLTEHKFAIKKVIDFDEVQDKKIALLVQKEAKHVDAFLIDVQDSGIYSQALVTGLKSLLKLAVRYKKKVVVLDRPNPLGRIIEGPGAIPWRHGLTVGELTLYLNRHRSEQVSDVTVVSMCRWKRTDAISGTLAKSLGTFLQAMHYVDPLVVDDQDSGYAQTILLKNKEKLSRWETRYLKRLCWHLGLHCVGRSVSNENCDDCLHGVKLSLKTDINRFSGFNAVMTVARFFKNRKQIQLSCQKDFDGVFGSKSLRHFLEGRLAFSAMKKEMSESLQTFYDKSVHCCLYRPLPVVVEPEIVKV